MNQKIPQHVAIVMDGNGRWAENRGLERVDGHRAGVNSVKEVIRCCLHHRISTLSLFAFSSENWSRPEMEVDCLMQLFVDALHQEVNELHRHGIRVVFTGDRTQLSQLLQASMLSAENLTRSNQQLILNIVINYGGKWDIVQAAQQLAKRVGEGKLAWEDITENTFAEVLNTKDLPDPDLLIRTSGEQRISNFFLWQLSFTELYFSEVYWPDFTTEEFKKALDWFNHRERRFGLTSQQLTEKPHV